MKVFIALLLTTSSTLAADFKKDIQPILEKHCYECHSEKAGKKKAGYVFDDLETLQKDINPKGAIVPGNPAESHLLSSLQMQSMRRICHRRTIFPVVK